MRPAAGGARRRGWRRTGRSGRGSGRRAARRSARRPGRPRPAAPSDRPPGPRRRPRATGRASPARSPRSRYREPAREHRPTAQCPAGHAGRRAPGGRSSAGRRTASRRSRVVTATTRAICSAAGAVRRWCCRASRGRAVVASSPISETPPASHCAARKLTRSSARKVSRRCSLVGEDRRGDRRRHVRGQVPETGAARGRAARRAASTTPPTSTKRTNWAGASSCRKRATTRWAVPATRCGAAAGSSPTTSAAAAERTQGRAGHGLSSPVGPERMCWSNGASWVKAPLRANGCQPGTCPRSLDSSPWPGSRSPVRGRIGGAVGASPAGVGGRS